MSATYSVDDDGARILAWFGGLQEPALRLRASRGTEADACWAIDVFEQLEETERAAHLRAMLPEARK